MPQDVGYAAQRLPALLEEADEYCRWGEHLVTTPADTDVAAFRRWYLGESVARAAGGDPSPLDGVRPLLTRRAAAQPTAPRQGPGTRTGRPPR